MHLVVTCGPAFAPIDGTRRLTNFSTGRLGLFLAGAFVRAGHEVTVLRGSGATFQAEVPGARVISFDTNDDVLARFQELSAAGGVGAVFHLAALCDFAVAEALDAEGRPLPAGKIPSRGEGCRLVLQPLPKVIHRLRNLFPDAFLAGWKYETEGGREQVLTLARRQIDESRTDLCVANGPGFGAGFGLLDASGSTATASDPAALAAALLARLAR